MNRRTFLFRLAVIALLATGLGLWAAAPAFAAHKPIGLSADGVTFADNLPASLFAGVVIVPGAAVTRSFWVKNRETSPANIAIALQGVTGADHAMVAALSVNAVAGAASGPAVAFAAAAPCHPLVSAVGLAPGAISRVDVTLELSSALPARVSQGSLGAFNLRVTMTSADVAAPNGCAAPVSPVDGDSGGTPPLGVIDSVIVSGAADATLPDGSGVADTSGSGEGVAAASVASNTARLFQEIYLAAWLAAAVLGGIFAAWRRSRDPEEDFA